MRTEDRVCEGSLLLLLILKYRLEFAVQRHKVERGKAGYAGSVCCSV